MPYDNTNKGAIWIRKAKSGLMYKSGTLNVEGVDYKITMFDNQQKRNENQPDFNIIIEEQGENNNVPQNNKPMQQTDITKPKEKTWQEKEADKFEEISIEGILF